MIEGTLLRPRHLLLFALIGVLGIIGGLFIRRPDTLSSLISPARSERTNVAGTASTDSAAAIVPAPKTIEKLVSKADLVIVGTVGDLIQEGSFMGYDDKGNLLKAKDKNLPPEAEGAFFDFEIKVEDVILDDGTIKAGKPVILRTYFKRPTAEIDPTLEYPGVYPGDHYLFLLTRNPDKQTHTLYYASASRLLIDGPEVMMSDGARTAPPFAKKVKPNDFIKQLKEAIKDKR